MNLENSKNMMKNRRKQLISRKKMINMNLLRCRRNKKNNSRLRDKNYISRNNNRKRSIVYRIGLISLKTAYKREKHLWQVVANSKKDRLAAIAKISKDNLVHPTIETKINLREFKLVRQIGIPVNRCLLINADAM